MTEAKIRLELQKDEAAEATQGKGPVRATSATGFLAVGMQLEETQ